MRIVLVRVILSLTATCTGTACLADARDDPPAPDDPVADFLTCIPDADDGPIFKETLTLKSADGETLVRIVRRPGDGPTIGETFAFELLGFAFQDGNDEGRVTCVVDAESLTYDYQHHNWDETATATSGSGDDARTLTLTLVYDVVTNTWTDVLHDSVTDQELLLPIVDECVSEGPNPLNGCFQRQ